MGADTAVKMPSQITVVAQNTEARRVAVGFEPTVHLVACRAQMGIAAVFTPIPIDMIYAQERFIRKPTTLTFTAVCRQGLLPNLEAVAFIDSPHVFTVKRHPFLAVFSSIGNQVFAMLLIIPAVPLSLAAQSFIVREFKTHA